MEDCIYVRTTWETVFIRGRQGILNSLEGHIHED